MHAPDSNTNFATNFFDGITGTPEEAYVYQTGFVTIPDGTTARAAIKKFVMALGSDKGYPYDHYVITWQLVDGDYKGEQVSQKLKVWDAEKPEVAKRAKNMLVLLHRLAGQQLPLAAPTDHALLPFVGKVMGIKIAEWQIPSSKEPNRIMEGNYVSEVHAITPDFTTATGTKRAPMVRAAAAPAYPPSALTRGREAAMQRAAMDVPFLNDDIPF